MIAAPPPPAVQPIQRYFKDWLLVCDNGRRCTAKAVPADPDDGLAAIGMTVVREPGPAGALSVSLYEADGKMDPAETVLDDTPLHPPYRTDKAGALHLSGEPAAAFLRKVRGGRLLRGAHTDDGPWVLLSGLSAALLAMDDAQGRVGTVTALAKPGPKPASAVPAAPPLPVVRAARPPPPPKDAAALAAAVRRAAAHDLSVHGCHVSPNTPEDGAYALNPTEAIVTLGCNVGAGGQTWSLAYLAPRIAPARAALLRLPPPPSLYPHEESPEAVGSYTLGEFNPRTMTFSSTMGWHVSNCGFATRWVFDGTVFHLAHHEEQTRCGGESAEWPVVFRSRVMPAG